MAVLPALLDSFFFSSRRRHTRCSRDWSSDVCSSDLSDLKSVGLPIQKLQDALTYALQIGEALHEAHSKRIVHRDIKCENIMVNSKNQIKVMDFGLAKIGRASCRERV